MAKEFNEKFYDMLYKHCSLSIAKNDGWNGRFGPIDLWYEKGEAKDRNERELAEYMRTIIEFLYLAREKDIKAYIAGDLT